MLESESTRCCGQHDHRARQSRDQGRRGWIQFGGAERSHPDETRGSSKFRCPSSKATQAYRQRGLPNLRTLHLFNLLILAAQGNRTPFASPDGEQRGGWGRPAPPSQILSVEGGSHGIARSAKGREGVDEVPRPGWGSRTRGRRSPTSRPASPAWNVPAPARCWAQHVHNCLWGGVAHAGSSPTVELVSGPLCPWREAGGITGRAPGGSQEPG